MSTSDWDRIVPRLRVLSDNDYGGDPDGLVQLAHLLLSPSVEVPAIVSSHFTPLAGLADPGGTAARGAGAATRVAEMCGRSDVPVLTGSEAGLVGRTEPVESAGARRIVDEAMRDDTDLPLFVTCGGSLTEIASAWLIEPRIAERLTLVWIGGSEYPDLTEPPPGGGDMEYNTGLDPVSAQVVFDDSDLDIWQVPRSTYRMAISTRADLRRRLRPAGKLGAYLYDALAGVAELAGSHGVNVGESYVLGDNPLVLLTALWTGFEPGPASSSWVRRPCPAIEDSGRYRDVDGARSIRVFTGIDVRLMFDDLFAKLDELGEAT